MPCDDDCKTCDLFVLKSGRPRGGELIAGGSAGRCAVGRDAAQIKAPLSAPILWALSRSLHSLLDTGQVRRSCCDDCCPSHASARRSRSLSPICIPTCGPCRRAHSIREYAHRQRRRGAQLGREPLDHHSRQGEQLLLSRCRSGTLTALSLGPCGISYCRSPRHSRLSSPGLRSDRGT